jgi:hypothetical protein
MKPNQTQVFDATPSLFAYKSTWRMIFFLILLLKPSRGLSPKGKTKWVLIGIGWFHVAK